MTFVEGATPSLEAVPFAIEGDGKAVRLARRIAKHLRGDPFTIRKEHKAAYHAWGAFTSPLLVALLVTAEQVALAAGVSAPASRRKMLSILRQTLSNYAELGPGHAFTGPVVRGDVEVIRKHLKVLRKIPEADKVYRALVRVALRHLPTQREAELTGLLRE
jgi:predicted short-subunit dehydrogenase-like oxidoreductase (DUF2520 family)